MKLLFSDIDIATASVEDIKAEISSLIDKKNDFGNEEQAIKIFINSIYGASASPYFACFNIKIAEAITLQGQDMNKYSMGMLDRYFKEFWHRDTATHEKMNIKVTNKINLDSVVIYGDTDSVQSDSIIHTTNGSYTIEELYNFGENDMGSTQNGHESVGCTFSVLNWSQHKGLYYSKPKRIIRHKVNKERYKLTTKSGKELYVTGDHSLIIFRNSQQIVCTAKDVRKNDKVLSLDFEANKTIFENVNIVIDSDFNSYVYDIEMLDETHSFIANNILVHNSVYLTFDDAIKSSDYVGSSTDFILNLYKYRLNEYINTFLEKYSASYNTDNIQSLELEKISLSAIILRKKKYALDIVWKDPGISYETCTHIDSKGVEIIQSSTPLFVRTHLNRLLIRLFKEKKNLNIKEFVDELRDIKEAFKLCSIDEIASSSSISDYNKFILNDVEKLEIGGHCPMHVRAAGIYNYKLNNSKYKGKYQLIKAGDKIKYYYVNSIKANENTFGFLPGSFPYEFAPNIDYDTQFTKLMIDPINRFVSAMGFGLIPSNLITSKRLF